MILSSPGARPAASVAGVGLGVGVGEGVGVGLAVGDELGTGKLLAPVKNDKTSVDSTVTVGVSR
jgi:hypothetical protein